MSDVSLLDVEKAASAVVSCFCDLCVFEQALPQLRLEQEISFGVSR